MRYYVTADTHGFFSLMRDALDRAGFFRDGADSRLVILGDLFDRGKEAKEMQDFILRQMDTGRLILVKGNHEDLFHLMLTEDEGLPYSRHVHNGTYDTALQLTGYDPVLARIRHYDFAEAAMRTPFHETIIPSMLDYYETGHYVFVHGWIPCAHDRAAGFRYDPDWRSAGPSGWEAARWYNGMDAAQSCAEEKTVLCGHWHASYGHWRYEGKGSEFGEDADHSPYYGRGVIALDACTVLSRRVNVIVFEDDPVA